MQLDYKLKMAQRQKLILTDSMKQNIEILQMSIYDLYKYIEKELEQNPVLEGEYNYDVKFNCRDNNYPFKFIIENKSLKDYLYDQLLGINLNERIKHILQYMIESIDDRGYLTESLDDICYRLKMKKEYVEESLNILQNLDPVGIGAGNLKECLLIQARKKCSLDDKLEIIILKYLQLVADNNYSLISKYLDITEKQAQGYIDIIKQFEPKPSRGFFIGEETGFIVPDAYVVKENRKYKVVMNNYILPTLNINSLYTNIMNDTSSEEDKYIRKSILSAQNLIKSIEARKTTLCRVLEYLVENQQEYFDKGIRFLKPKTLNEAAEDLGIHPSTISRTIKDKYIFTSFGTIKIKKLFCSGISYKNSTGEEVSVSVIKIKIENLIKKENKNKPLSDQAISNILNEENLRISRRTVAKYREEIGIKSSAKRKRL